MTIEEFAKGWYHFCECIDFARSNMDAESIRFMNEMPAAVAKGLTGPMPTPLIQTCRKCGCNDINACPEGCTLVEPDLCSRCA